MTLPASLKWTLLALLGIAVAAAVAIAASSLASRQIGLASEPISAGDALAPAAPHPKPKPKPSPQAPAKPPPTTTTPPATPPETTAPPATGEGDDHGDSSHGADD